MPPRTYLNLNRVWVDSRLRAIAQERLEAAALLRIGGALGGGRALDLGTGRRGTGARLAVELFDASHVTAVDLFPESVGAARAALRGLGAQVTAEIGDATNLRHADATFDGVFVYHTFHHLPDWRAGLAEAVRVLKPGGRLYVSELTREFVDAPWLRAVSYHPPDDRFSASELLDAVEAHGLTYRGGPLVAAKDMWVRFVAAKPPE
jgi:ubiquinone/menaquinone biosynthesis C-methylase UbiE